MAIKVQDTAIPGVKLITPRIFQDQRGSFVKVYHQEIFDSFSIDLDMKEEFYSTSKKNVLRGMHFQTPPYHHHKFVYCPFGKSLDVIVDLRKDSPTYKKCESFELSSENAHCLFIPKGLAHGFLGLSDYMIMVYKTSSVYKPEKDTGIRWDSIDFKWPLDNPITSDRDQKFQTLEEYSSPFTKEFSI